MVDSEQNQQKEEPVGSLVKATFERDGGRSPIAAAVNFFVLFVYFKICNPKSLCILFSQLSIEIVVKDIIFREIYS